MQSVARHVFVGGRVQGVGFRWSTRDQALHLGLDGWVRNLFDGRVEVWIEGAPDAVGRLESWLARGPSAARVDEVVANDAVAQGLSGFSIRRD